MVQSWDTSGWRMNVHLTPLPAKASLGGRLTRHLVSTFPCRHRPFARKNRATKVSTREMRKAAMKPAAWRPWLGRTCMERRESEVPSCYRHLTSQSGRWPQGSVNHRQKTGAEKPRRLKAGEWLPQAGREGMRATVYRYWISPGNDVNVLELYSNNGLTILDSHNINAINFLFCYYVYTYMNMHTHAHIHTCTHTHMHIYAHTFTNIYTHTQHPHYKNWSTSPCVRACVLDFVLVL